MINPEFKAGFESGDLRANFRLCRNEDGFEIAIYNPGNWEIGVRGDTLEEALARFPRIIARQVAECSKPISDES
jgi:hypothetical protein